MANADNKCADLEVQDFHAESEDTLGLIYNKQVELQKRLGFDFTGWNLKQIADFCKGPCSLPVSHWRR